MRPMPNTTRPLIAASLFLAVAAAVPAAEADPIVVDADSLVPTIMHCDPILGCSVIHPTLPEVGGSCSVSGDGDGIRAECHGN
jgi:hypothetical protein